MSLGDQLKNDFAAMGNVTKDPQGALMGALSIGSLGLAPKIFHGLAGLLAKATGGEVDFTPVTSEIDSAASKAMGTVGNAASTVVSKVGSELMGQLGQFSPPTVGGKDASRDADGPTP